MKLALHCCISTSFLCFYFESKVIAVVICKWFDDAEQHPLEAGLQWCQRAEVSSTSSGMQSITVVSKSWFRDLQGALVGVAGVGSTTKWQTVTYFKDEKSRDVSRNVLRRPAVNVNSFTKEAPCVCPSNVFAVDDVITFSYFCYLFIAL